MSAVETIRDIPVIVEHRKSCSGDPMMVDENYYDTSGFPFDNRRSRDPLEDIAQRHPELAQHLQGFPRRTPRSETNDDEFLRRRFERPFASGRFERFGFPFNRDDFEREPQRYYEAYPEYFENFQNQQPQSPQHSHHQASQSPQYSQQYPPHYSQQYPQEYSQQSQEGQRNEPSQEHSPTSQQSQGTQTEPDFDHSTGGGKLKEEGHTRGRPIQQSNTCNLGQKQPPDDSVNDRNQRSMSAPPENKRFSSSVKIPMGGLQGQENGAKPQSQTAGSGSTERVIPIHVEGRDDPVIPKNFTTTSHPPPQTERIFTDSPRPQPERIFGQRPEHFTQFVHRDSPSRFGGDWHTSPFESRHGFPEEEFYRSGSPSRFGATKNQSTQQSQGSQPQKQHPGPQYQQPQPQHQQQKSQPANEQPRAQSEEEQQQQPKPQPQKQPQGPIEQIQAIQKDVSSLLRQVEAFKGAPKDKNYLYLDEMLTRNLLKLDDIDTQGQDTIRSARKEAIKCIERAIGVLEAKAAANIAPKEDKMEVEQAQKNQEIVVAKEAMDVGASHEQKVEEASNMEAQSQDNQLEESGNSGNLEKEDKSEKNMELVLEEAKVDEKKKMKNEQEAVKEETVDKRENNDEKMEVKQDNDENKVSEGNKKVEQEIKKGEEQKADGGEQVKQEVVSEVKPEVEKKEKKKIKKKKEDKEKEKKQ